LDSNVIAWQQGNGIIYQLGRVDNPIFTNEFGLFYLNGVKMTATVNGVTTKAVFASCDFDSTAVMARISDGVGGNTATFVGCFNQGFGGDASNGVVIEGAGGSNFIRLVGCQIRVHDSCIVQISATGTGNRVLISNCDMSQWSLGGGSVSALLSSVGNFIRSDSVCTFFSTASTAIAGNTGQIIPDNPMRNLGQLSIPPANTNANIAHFLGTAPTLFNVTAVTPIGTASTWWVTADATNVTVNLNVAPGSTATFDVQAGVTVNT
jgi:hypothetical protein